MTLSRKRTALILAILALAVAGWFSFQTPEFVRPAIPVPEAIATQTAMPRSEAEAPVGGTKVAAFAQWTERFLAASSQDEKRSLVDEGITLATARRIELKSLIVKDPRMAIEAAVPPVIRQQLPRAVAERLEERVNEAAFFGVLGALPGAGSDVGPPIRRHVRTDDGGNYRAFVYGTRMAQKTTERASIVGIAVDDFLAVDQSPLRVVGQGEIPNHPNNLTQRRSVTTRDEAGFSADRVLREMAASKPIVEVCPVSGIETPVPEKAAPISAEQPVIEAEGKFQFLCSGGHIHEYRDALVAREGGNGGPSLPTNPPSTTQSTGYRTHLLMRVAFPEALRASVTEKEGYTLGQGVQDWFVDSSYGKLSFITTVTPTIVLPRSEAWYKSQDTGSAFEVLYDARVASKAAGFDPANFHFDTVIYTGSPGSFGGQAYVGSKGCWLKTGTGVGVAAHEYGHNFGLWHANSWNTSETSVIGGGAHVEYGDSFDTMGSASAGDLQFNACHKNLLGWIPSALVHSVETSGTYRIYQMDQPRQDPALKYGLKVRKDSDRDYWVDLRQKFSTNKWVQGGVFLHWSPWAASEGGSHLLDTTPGSPDGKTDAPIVVGTTFSDTETGIHITPVAKNATVPPSFDVVVNLGTFPANQAPVLAMTANSTAVGTNATVTFTATASDANGDTLSYAWDFGDKDFATTNNAVVTKSWATAGDYVVRCVASDMKGGTAARSVVVRVGSPTTFRVSGTITLGGQPLANVRVHNGLSSSSYRGTYTDSDGAFTIVGLTAATYTIGAQRYGYTFTPATTATATVGPDGTGVNFTAAAANTVSISAVTPAVGEGASGTFRITRTGSTSAALTVNGLLPAGSASNGSDYTLTPAQVFSDPYYTFTIPSGQASLDITFAAQNDTGVEGTERATLQLAPGSSYVLTNATATIDITDPDTANSYVRLRTVDNDATESGNPGQFIIERIGGNQSGALNVVIAMSGSATNGTDYTTISSTAVIPAGQPEVAVNVTPVADSLVEGTEVATLTISTNAAYIRAASSADYAGSVNIADAQIPTLTVTATDAAAAEAGSDPGIFLISRTGDTTLPLSVGYGLTGTALHGTDFLAVPGQLTIPAGAVAGSVVITPVDDAIGEPAQTARLYLRASDKYVIGTPGDATVTITDSSDVPYVTIGVTTAQAVEPGTTGTFRITTSGTGTGNINVLYTVTGTATNGVDFTTLSGTASVGRNSTANVTITPIQDTELEGYETITITLIPDAAYSLSVDNAATMNLQDDDAPQINVSTTDDGFSETAGTIAKFYVSRTGSTTNALTVTYTMAGTAESGVDYTAPSGSVTIPAAAQGAFVDIAILDDTLAEGTETITLQVAPTATYTAGNGSATHTLDDAESPTFSFRFNPNTITVAENVGSVTATITLSGAVASDTSVEYFINGGTALAGGIDYTLLRGVVTFLAGETSHDVVIPIADNTAPESSETIVLTLDNPAGARLTSTTANQTVTITITDNDQVALPTVGFSQLTATGAESVSPAPIFVILSNPQAAPVSVDYAVTGGTATSGSDYNISAGTLTFAAGETAKVLPGTITDDGAQESSETIIVTLSNPTAATLNQNVSHTYTITDNDAVTITIAATTQAAEPGANGLFTLTRTGSTTGALTVNLTISGTATSGGDYTAIPATVDFLAGSATATVPVNVIDDSVGEVVETIIATVAAGGYTVGSPSVATINLTDDEPGVTITASDASAGEPGGNTGTIVVTRSGSTAAALTVNATISGTATAGTDFDAISTPIVIPAGSASAALTVTPLDDFVPESNETVIVTINGGVYLISGPASATVTITDDDVNNAPVVTITSPTVAAISMEHGNGLILEATVSDDGKPVGGTLTTGWTMLSGTGTATFATPSQANSTVTFSAPGSYVLRLSANDGEFQTNDDLTVTVLTANNSWTGTNIAGATPVGSFSESSGSITVNGGGTNITGSADTFYFVNQPLFGNTDFRARVVSMTGGGSSAKAGVMIRQGTGTGSRGAYMSSYGTGSNTSSWRLRATDNAAWSTTSVAGTPSFPFWVRVVRTGTTFTGYRSADGVAWTQVGTGSVTAPTDPLLLGLAVTSNNTSQLCAAVFDNVTITTPGNIAPLVAAGDDASVTIPQPVALDGSVDDDTLATSLWEKISGPGSVTFVDPAAPQTTATFGAPGSYVLRLVGNDGQAKTFDELTITTTLPTVAITASAATATEVNSPLTTFTITRTGSSDFTLSVNFTRTGTASPADYTDVGGTIALGNVSIPVGTGSTAITTSAILDADVEGTETLTLTVTAAPAYAPGSPASATLSILDAPVISVAATAVNAAEFGLVPGEFTVTRTGDTSASLGFTVAWSGTATRSADYTDSGTSFAFSAGSATAVISLAPLADALAEGTETATLTAQTGSYAIGSGNATVTIADLPGDDWRYVKFGGDSANPAIAGDFADPDGDGIVNLLEYGFAQEPLANNSAPAFALDGGDITLIYRRNLLAPDLTYVVQKSSNVSIWEPALPTEEILSDNGSVRTIRARVPIGPAGAKFLRIEVRRP